MATGGDFYLAIDIYQGQRTSFFMRAIGYPFSYPSPEQIDAAIARGWSMPSWPSAGSVVFEDGVAIVRFSEPEERSIATEDNSESLRIGSPSTVEQSQVGVSDGGPGVGRCGPGPRGGAQGFVLR